MTLPTLLIAFSGLFSTISGVTSYMAKLKKSKTPKVPITLFIGFILGNGLGAYALYLASTTTEIAVAFTLFLTSFSITALLLFFLFKRKVPLGDIKVKVGGPVLPFIAASAKGDTFTNENLLGKRTLFKFYRGSWCPYCCAELSMFNDLKTELKTHNIQTIALSGDTAEQALIHTQRDKLNMLLLGDPQLEVIRTFGVEHQKAIGWDSTNMKTFFGVSMSMNMFKVRSMSVPTTLLIDEHGVIQWIDQSDDYRIRASKERILQAIKQYF